MIISPLLVPVGEGGNASAQPAASVANAWNPPQRRRIVLIRHGDVAYFDAQGKPVANPDVVVLSEKGRAQADATGAYLKTMGIEKFDRVISSTLPRTVETAERVMAALGHPEEPDQVGALKEIRTGSSYIPTAELPQAFLGMVDHRVSGDQRFLRGENVAALQARIEPALTDAARRQRLGHSFVVASLCSKHSNTVPRVDRRCLVLWQVRSRARLLLDHRCWRRFS